MQDFVHFKGKENNPVSAHAEGKIYNISENVKMEERFHGMLGSVYVGGKKSFCHKTNLGNAE